MTKSFGNLIDFSDLIAKFLSLQSWLYIHFSFVTGVYIVLMILIVMFARNNAIRRQIYNINSSFAVSCSVMILIFWCITAISFTFSASSVNANLFKPLLNLFKGFAPLYFAFSLILSFMYTVNDRISPKDDTDESYARILKHRK